MRFDKPNDDMLMATREPENNALAWGLYDRITGVIAEQIPGEATPEQSSSIVVAVGRVIHAMLRTLPPRGQYECTRMFCDTIIKKMRVPLFIGQKTQPMTEPVKAVAGDDERYAQATALAQRFNDTLGNVEDAAIICAAFGILLDAYFKQLEPSARLELGRDFINMVITVLGIPLRVETVS